MTETQTIAGAKQAMRTRMVALRGALADVARQGAARTLLRVGVGLPCLAPEAVVAGYVAMRGEIDPTLVLAALAARGHLLVLPVVTGDGALEFHRWLPGEELVKGAHGVPVPAPGAEVLEPDLVLVPLVAFDRAGYRLGLGLGYYDRTLEALRGTRDIVAVGVAFDEQEVAEVPRESHDQRLDWMLTPSGAFAVGD
jgi:5-formyltetrahydrofolate cyclo-ligase